MQLLLYILTLLAGLAIIHTYVIYPWWTVRRAHKYINRGPAATNVNPIPYLHSTLITNSSGWFGINSNKTISSSIEQVANWPKVSVLMAVHNEEAVLESKLKSLLAQDYSGEYQIYIGSDNSTDATNDILTRYQSAHANIHIRLFAKRQGKPGIINQLVGLAGGIGPDHCFLLTDASVILEHNVITKLAYPMCLHADLAMADARMVHTGMQAAGIGQSENLYINREVALKQAEGLLWGFTIGPFGGCYLLRSNYYQAVPNTFLVDDFFLCLYAYEQGGRGISVPDALCYEGVGQNLKDEFKRKVRISAGNWQNTWRFLNQWWPPFQLLNYAFFSHKILRWLTPMLILMIVIGLGLLGFGFGNYWPRILFGLILVGAIAPSLIDQILIKVFDTHWQALRSLRYFLAMNLALLIGFFRYLKGIKTNVWQPSKRH